MRLKTGSLGMDPRLSASAFGFYAGNTADLQVKKIG
jgi:hypothetical protein